MKRKYYMRGLGVGILLTTLVFSFLNMSEPTEEEIRKKAEELGYVLPGPTETPGINLDELMGKETPKPTNNPELTDTPVVTETPEVTNVPEGKLTPTPTVVPTPTVMLTPTVTPTDVPSVTPIPVVTEAPTPTNIPMPSETPEPTEVSEVTPTPTVAVVKAQIHIAKGSTGSQVCRMIAQAGIVEDAEELRSYIRGRNLINEINVGTFELSSDMSFEEITKIITGK